MHPQDPSQRAGNCPMCGMALEPLEPALEDGPHPELIDVTRRFWLGASLSMPPGRVDPRRRGLRPPVAANGHLDVAQLALATPVVLWGGWPFFERFWASLRSRHLNMFTLIGLPASGLPTPTASSRRSRRRCSRRRRARWADWSPSTSRRPRSSSRSSCWARCSSLRPERDRQGDPRLAGPCTERRRARSRTTGRKRTSPSSKCMSATSCASGPGEEGPRRRRIVVEGRSAVGRSP